MTEKDVFGWLAEVQHPGKDDKDLVSLGMVEEVTVEPGRVVVTLAFGKRPDPLKNYLEGAVRAAIYRNAPGGTDVEVKTVVKEAPKPKKPALDLNLDQVNEVSHIIGIASGKGGVGKSTVAVNLAIALARLGYRVGLADADVYGPSVPIMTATEELQPEAEPGEEEGKELFIPIEKYGVKWMSIGYFAQPGQALIWRGPMACSALKQMILQVKWGPLDYLLIDMPPGTGDIHISLVNDIPVEGAVIVTTPQPVALAAWFTPEEHPDEKYYIFGQGGGAEMAGRFGIDLLGQIPLVQSIREAGDAGEPVALGTRPDSLAFLELARKLVDAVNKE